MKTFLTLFIALVFCVAATAQQPDDATSLTLENGKVLHFASAEAKAKFLAARQRRQEGASSPVGPAMTPAQAGQLPFITLQAVRGESGAQFAYNWLSDYGSYDVSVQQSVDVDVSLRNMSRSSASIIVRTLFFSHGITDHNIALFLLADRRLELAPGQTAAFPMASGNVDSRDQNYVLIGQRLTDGERYEGWVVQVLTSDERLIRQIGSGGHLEDWAGSEDFRKRVLPAWKELHAKNTASR